MHDRGTLFRSLTTKSKNDKFDFFFVDGKEECHFSDTEKILHSRLMESCFYRWLIQVFTVNEKKFAVFDFNEYLFSFNGDAFLNVTGCETYRCGERFYVFNPLYVPREDVKRNRLTIDGYSKSGLLIPFGEMIMNAVFCFFFIMLISIAVHRQMIEVSFNLFIIPIVTYYGLKTVSIITYLYHAFLFYVSLGGSSMLLKSPIVLYGKAKKTITLNEWKGNKSLIVRYTNLPLTKVQGMAMKKLKEEWNHAFITEMRILKWEETK